ncbi:DNA cytosine methyltransferase [Mesorhizobium sp. Z1-4]|uniref:DNA cytosine methyltransferase n=1 Tax=Mesorhizobium sp. Z1-4 TaxID=2448478 RepID=UPI000FD8007A|nr:DNA cytosine methyltransferase [Mesorhizobium sp. Z1-4]
MRDFVQMPSGLLIPESVAVRESRKMRRPKAMDFFSGAGGFSLGFIQAGYEVVAAAEWDPMAVMTYMANLCRYGECQMHFVTDDDRERTEKAFAGVYKRSGINIKNGDVVAAKGMLADIPRAGSGWIAGQPRSTPGVSHIFVGDVRKLETQRILDTLGMTKGELDAVCGGPPCQGYSTAGKRDVYDPRNSLVFEYARFIVELGPKAMVMEEVANIMNMVTPEGHPVIDQFCRILEDGGFQGFNALQQALGVKPNAKVAIRGKGNRADMKKAGVKVDDDDDVRELSPQADLFAETAA